MQNGVLFQFFHWNYPATGTLWNDLGAKARELASKGVSAVWMPPAYKGADGAADTGYAVYDLFDLGEFDQKGSVPTKYGTRDQMHGAVRAAQEAGLQVYADVVFNHRSGADETEEVEAVEVDMANRNETVTAPYRMHAWTKFTFPGRGSAYSTFRWNSEHFTSVDCNADAPSENKLYLLNGKSFHEEVSSEFGNFDHLIGCDVDLLHPAVRDELFAWGRWFAEETGVDGFRLDAVKHIPARFFPDFFEHVRTHFGQKEMLGIGEYWSGDVRELHSYLELVGGVMKLFDVPLHFRFVEAAKGGDRFDLRTIFDGTLTAANPLSSVTFVDNHDTEPGQSLESWVDDWFKPLAYALILLRDEGYPTIFYPDYFEAQGFTSHRFLLDAMLAARQRYHFGDQHDWFDHPNCIGWTRTGDPEHPGSMVVLMSNGDSGFKRVNAFAPNATFEDITRHVPETISTDADGFGDFTCPAGSLSVWVQR